MGITLRGMALVETALGAYKDAEQVATEGAGPLFAERGLELDIAMSFNCLGWARFGAGRYAEAEDAYVAALDSSGRCGSTYEAARAETGLGNVAAARGGRRTPRHWWNLADERRVLRDPTVVGELRARGITGGAGLTPRGGGGGGGVTSGYLFYPGFVHGSRRRSP